MKAMHAGSPGAFSDVEQPDLLNYADGPGQPIRRSLGWLIFSVFSGIFTLLVGGDRTAAAPGGPKTSFLATSGLWLALHVGSGMQIWRPLILVPSVILFTLARYYRGSV